MKIEGSGSKPVSQTDQSQQAERTSAVRPGQSERAPQAAGDRVNVSSDARLVTEAVRAANQAPDIRRDAVERAKARLEAGEIGRDPARLADRIIDDLLKG